MEEKKVSRRLYVGGLGHTVSKDELQERFGKFGHVLDAEIITRKDDQGNPMKTFAYISVSISDADLQKCVSILNKTKWKGGTLQIELAKESFLHRLAVEREELKLQKEKLRRNDKTCLLESLKKAGVVDFHMKAVPGTEVPDHKKWVVGKFGRVLPILHLRNQQKNKIVKYDPSKYCHNLRKLEPDWTHVAPISELTWHLEGRDNSINKKRQGEFPVTKNPPKKLRQLGSETLNGAVVLSSGCQSHSQNTSLPHLDQRSKSKLSEKSKLPPSRILNSKISGRGYSSDKSNVSGITAQNNMSVSDSDIDSEEEIRAMVKKEIEIQKDENIETESDQLEIVGDNFELKYNSHWSVSNPDAMRKAVKGNYREKETMECDNDYDSADTDEIIAESKILDQSSRETVILEDAKQMKVENKEIVTNKKCDLVHDSSLKTCNLKKEYIERKGKRKNSKVALLQSTAVNSTTKTGDSESSYSESETGESEISSDYESTMQNCCRLDLTLDDLKALATENTGTPVEESDSTQSSSQCSVEENSNGSVNKTKLSKFHPAVKKKCVCPEDIVAALLAGENADEESSKTQNHSRSKYQPFRGMGSLCEKELTKDSTGLKKRSVGSLGLEARISYRGKEASERQSKNSPLYSLEVSGKKRQNAHCEQHKEVSDAASLEDERDQPVSRPRLQGKKRGVSSLQDNQNSKRGDAAPSTDHSEAESSDVDSNAAVSQKHVKRQLKSPKSLSEKLRRDVSNKNLECEASKCENGKTSLLENKEFCLRATVSKETSTKEKQLQDNQRRLAALEERQKERELQKKLIQGALSNLDSQPAGKHKHIVFNSDLESEAEVEEMLKKDASLENTHEEDKSAPKTPVRLFESSEDEQDDTDSERFKIKPQFEGKSGEKLLKLQSRFGTDERFRMDARFLESDSEEETNNLKADEEEELAAEKKKNLQILGSLLNINLEHPKATKMAASAKKFKDINALRYDPTRQDHAVFERKPSATEKESKAKRKKKREESEKLPEVSKEMYYDIAADLKELFRSSNTVSEKKEEIPWDKDDADNSTPPDHLRLNVGSNIAQESSGFTFSFFGDMEESGIKEEPYILETIKPVKVTWQEDPRFQDSSSEGDDEPEASEDERDKEMLFSLPQTESVRFFFFSRDDERLREGPKLFCRSVDLSEEKDGWEDRRRLLLEECRKKHKDARRKVKAKQ
ncbi:nucleolar protein 8 [Tyto alba]|uniref:nucleolar protein 8 n=1 Tax=Tyto alba TaxID=56313 RepID=UPI001403679A|nr:nucleolar protein 8 [Tyto alba]XP_032858946.1 nucleolar protein 8 [Tyto alba]XP_032858948.1 nucleolar protein 8 [Tyto alba]XP_032858949.1 nucleolar protein 8 [Tyto alba]XP_042655593.1 nucleolar protein 8 [Tyto alba]XP_042655594.1 nucleolar protein 8 [Tyto alba]XP_042655595.1 nucleolar protein 8 [Tyto alba]